MSLKTAVFGLDFKNPLVMSAGVLGVSHSTMIRAFNHGAGAVTTKSISRKANTGHNNPTVIAYETGLLNAIGLSNPGIDAFVDEIKKVKENKVPLILSVVGILNTKGDKPQRNMIEVMIQDMVEVARQGESTGVDILEINPSCPNVDYKPYKDKPELLYEVVGEIKKEINIPVVVKLSPNDPDIEETAKGCEVAHANGITAINTVKGMLIDIKSKKPILSFKKGGISGPAIRPIAIRCVYDIYESVKIPIIGVGGVINGKDAIEMMMAGASMVGIGSAVYYGNIDVFNSVASEMEKWMGENGYKSVKKLVGIAHEPQNQLSHSCDNKRYS